VRIGYEAATLLARMLQGGKVARDYHIPRRPLGVFVRQSTDTFAADDPLVARAIRAMQQRAHVPTTVADLLHELKVSRRKLEYHFQDVLGKSPGQIIRFLQNSRAKQMLHTSPLPLATIAVACGFTSVHHFNRAFRNDVGLTPAQYRAQATGFDRPEQTPAAPVPAAAT